MTTMELIERGIGHNCLSDAYDLGKTDGYRKAENDYFAKTESARENAYNCGYEMGKADAIDEISKAMYHEAFEANHEEDGLQKWDSGNWIRYKLFENVIDRVRGQNK